MSNRRKPATAKRTDKVVVAYLHPGQVSAFFCNSLLSSVLFDETHGNLIAGIVQEWSSANVSEPRNKLTGKFLDEYTADWLMWIDSDMGWEPDAIHRLVDAADPAERPIVGGLCFGGTEDALWPTMYNLGEVDGRPVSVRAGDYPDDSMVQVTATGAAFLLVHRTALEAIRDRAFNATFPWFQETELAGMPAGEDLTFCFRAGLVGLPVFVHTGIHVGHHKSRLLTHDLFRAQQRAAEEAG